MMVEGHSGVVDDGPLADRLMQLETQVSEQRALINRMLDRLVRADVLREGDFIDFLD